MSSAVSMQRLVYVFVLALAIIGDQIHSHRIGHDHVHVVQLQFATKSTPSVDLCPTCINFANEAIENLVNIIANFGVIGTCGKLCGILANDTGSQVIGVACDLFCSYVGIEEFIKIIEEVDLDAFYFCELVKVCPIFDGGDAKLLNITVSPRQGPQGTQFHVVVDYSTEKGTGTGEAIVEISTVDGIPLSDGEIQEEKQPGTYSMTWNVHAKPDPNCDPSQQPCEQWLPGNYTAKVALCNGECGSSHPHSQIYFEGSAGFVLTDG
eukprot:m.306495 g.306495  ORF g.306495 m.306495 type:complete len:265 (+) comp41298_c0_seq1:34-828(+)